jgi:hypothetical protein
VVHSPNGAKAKVGREISPRDGFQEVHLHWRVSVPEFIKFTSFRGIFAIANGPMR